MRETEKNGSCKTVLNLILFFVSTCLWVVGVSNWGGYGMACALYILSLCPIHQRYLHKGLGQPHPPTQDQHQAWAASLPSVAKVR